MPYRELRRLLVTSEKMARLGGITSNTSADDLFESLEDWNTYLKAENFDFEKLSQGLNERPDVKNSPCGEMRQKKPKQRKRPQVRSPSP